MRSLVPLLCSVGSLSALNIQIDYSLDDRNFFDTQEKKDALEAVAKFYGDLIQDNLLRIDGSEFSNSTWTPLVVHPATGNNFQLPNMVVPEDTIIVYAGSRDLGLSATKNVVGGRGSMGGVAGVAARAPGFLDRLFGRGQEEAAPNFQNGSTSEITDISLWGGSVTFNDSINWNFSLEENQPGQEFLALALHEMGHVLGLGSAFSWNNLLSNGAFTGPAAIKSHGTAPPATRDRSHFEAGLESPTFGSFGAPHGTMRPVRMLPSEPIDDGSIFDVVTDLDLAALVDIGWEIAIPTPPITVSDVVDGEAVISWPSTSFYSYEFSKSTDLQTYEQIGKTISGEGTFQSWIDPSPSACGFYEFSAILSADLTAVTPPLDPKKSAAESQKSDVDSDEPKSFSMAPRGATGCYCDHHTDH